MNKLYLLLWLLPALGRAQALATCNCARNLAETQRLLETNYAGYRDKVTATTRPRLDSLLAALRPQADTARATSCEQVLRQYLAFFRDGHLQLSSTSAKLNADSVRALYAATARLPWTRASFRAYLDDPSRPKQPLEGIWRDGGDGGYVVGIVADGNIGYQAFVLRSDSIFWTPGQVKFTFADPAAAPTTATYYMRNHSAQPRPVRVVREGELYLNSSWYRTYPRPVAAPPAGAAHSFRMLDDTTALYRIASFNGNFRPKIDSLTKANAANLARTRLLILDVRGNGGGSDGSYRSLIPYLYTNPVQEVSTALYSTPENNSKYSSALYPDMSAVEKVFFAHLKRRLDAHPGQLVSLRGSKQVYTLRRSRRQLHPELARVAVLQDQNCGSTTEQFLLLAKQSRKTTTFGANSAGVLDYANMQFKALPCYGLRLGWATSRSFRLDRGQGIDNVGLAPTVRLDPTAPDLVEQVRAWYRKQK